MVKARIKTDRQMTVEGNWTDCTVSISNHVCEDMRPELCVRITIGGDDNLYTLDELRAIVAFAEQETARIMAEWEARDDA